MERTGRKLRFLTENDTKRICDGIYIYSVCDDGYNVNRTWIIVTVTKWRESRRCWFNDVRVKFGLDKTAGISNYGTEKTFRRVPSNRNSVGRRWLDIFPGRVLPARTIRKTNSRTYNSASMTADRVGVSVHAKTVTRLPYEKSLSSVPSRAIIFA